MSALTGIHLGGSSDPWVRLGLALGTEPSTLRVGGVACRFDVDSTAPVIALSVADLAAPVELDGLRFLPEAPGPRATSADHPCRASLIDHVVVMTSSLERTCGAVEAGLGAPLRRIRDVAPGVRQGFHRLGEVILEVVETPQVTADQAALWGLVVVVDDLDTWAGEIGPELVAPPKPAVQAGRRISNVRPAAGLGLPVAFMSPDPRTA